MSRLTTSFVRSRIGVIAFALMLIPFAGIPLLYFSYVPIWDGWEFSRCYLSSAVVGSDWCHDHSALLHTFLFGLTQRIEPGSFKLIYAANLLIGALGLVCLRLLLKRLYGGRLSPLNITLLTFCFGLNPVFLVHVIQPSLDFTLPVYLIMLLLFLFTGRFGFAAVAGLLLVFTKESGVMIYGVSACLYVAMAFLDRSLDGKDVKRLISVIGVLLVPLALFGVYMALESKTQIGSSWFEGIKKMFHFYLVDTVIAAQLVSLLVLNFAWIMAVFVAANLFVYAYLWLKPGSGPDRAASAPGGKYGRIYFYLLLFLFVYFLTRIPMWNNPRYMLPAAPLLVILFGDALSNVVRRQRLITAVLVITLALLAVSSVRTIDPVSKNIMGTFKFGSHELLKMTKFEGAGFTYGRDQMVYNFEFSQIHFILEKIYETIGIDKIYVIAPKAGWGKSFSSIDGGTGRRMIYGDGLTNVSIVFSDRLINHRLFPKEIYYIAFPNFEPKNKEQQTQLSYIYDTEEIITVENDGYAADVYHYVKKAGLR